MTIWPKSKLGNISVVFTVVPLLLALVIALAGAFQDLPLGGEMSDNLLLTFLLLMSLASFIISLLSGISSMLIRRERSMAVVASIVVSIVALAVSWSWWV
ncbi:hypothetical protein KQ939_05040 [Planococcus sp. CP5-4]|uniref:hypothetical protein n=1 Tax=unclassified Planococcus (in: firmicutes) TaxID=2662419 RepID=UPI001C22EE60|nr:MULTISPECIES: hypothetical protein [unclassified Planococcus (in: firmicutes)]MBU9673625.1 hypothetical protein [Planococcus sp. CP5-4_YE]MBV0907915.1 hypothetical protein [Planococcus sp. CP5-4_UN]MBW6063082.1 hypothetical protein [Planococcus sp. CP5-4]